MVKISKKNLIVPALDHGEEKSNIRKSFVPALDHGEEKSNIRNSSRRWIMVRRNLILVIRPGAGSW
jgi:hypothetical protein